MFTLRGGFSKFSPRWWDFQNFHTGGVIFKIFTPRGDFQNFRPEGRDFQNFNPDGVFQNFHPDRDLQTFHPRGVIFKIFTPRGDFLKIVTPREDFHPEGGFSKFSHLFSSVYFCALKTESSYTNEEKER